MPWFVVHYCSPNPIETLYKNKLRTDRGVVGNAFRMLRKTWRELLEMTQFIVKYLPDVITTCAILHNALLNQGVEDVERLLRHNENDGPDDVAMKILVMRCETMFALY